MKKLMILLVVGLLVGFSTCALGQATLNWGPLGSIGGYYTNGTGTGYGLTYPRGNWAVELAFTNLQGVAGYADGSDLITFCLEWDEGFILKSNNTYYAEISDGAIPGGVGGTPDTISLQTAWIYTEYIGGNTFGITDFNARAAYVQEAIWLLEEEQNPPAEWTQTDNIIADATAAVANGYDHNVKVLNITDENGVTRQDVLVIVPVPGAVLLGGFGVGLVGWFRRRKSL